jgi:hypothetical protein
MNTYHTPPWFSPSSTYDDRYRLIKNDWNTIIGVLYICIYKPIRMFLDSDSSVLQNLRFEIKCFIWGDSLEMKALYRSFDVRSMWTNFIYSVLSVSSWCYSSITQTPKQIRGRIYLWNILTQGCPKFTICSNVNCTQWQHQACDSTNLLDAFGFGYVLGYVLPNGELGTMRFYLCFCRNVVIGIALFCSMVST